MRFKFLLLLWLASVIGISSAIACDPPRGEALELTWSLPPDTGDWGPPESCDSALDALADAVRASRRVLVRVDTILGGDAPTARSLARLAGSTWRLTERLVERGVPRHRIRIREFRLPKLESFGVAEFGLIRVRVDDFRGA